MRRERLSQWSAAALYLVLVLGLLWCVADSSAQGARAIGMTVPDLVAASAVVGGSLWIIGHGVHGATAIALVALYLRRWQSNLVEQGSPALRRARWWGRPLVLASALSFLWCIMGTVSRSPVMPGVEMLNDLIVGTVFGGALWLLGHILHGVAVIALPTAILTNTQ